jgi:beta-lactamase regulating signal transducer with metallopeptidase domain
MSNLDYAAINRFAAIWTDIIWAVSWQFCGLGLVVLLIHLALSRAAPNWRYWLWQILALKLLMMPFWTAAAPWPQPTYEFEREFEMSNVSSSAAVLPEVRKDSIVTFEANDQTALPLMQEIASTPSDIRNENKSVATTWEGRATAPMNSPGLEQLSGKTSVKTGGTELNERADTRLPEPQNVSVPAHRIVSTSASNKTEKSTPLVKKQAVKPHPSITDGWDMMSNPPVPKPAVSATPLQEKPAALASQSSGRATVSELPLQRALTWKSWLMLLWSACVACFITRIVRQGMALGRRLRAAQPAGRELIQRVREAAKGLGMRHIPAVHVMPLSDSPFVCGLWQIRLVVPHGLLESLTSEQLDLVLLHELAHLQRRDLLWGWIPEIGKILFFFHPLAHFVSRQICFERELACDQLAMRAAGQDAATYAETLIRVVGQFSNRDSFTFDASAKGAH